MKLGMYSVFDSKLASFDRPYFSMTDGAAIRAFVDEVLEPKQNLVWKRHPEDYSLFHVGFFDDVTGSIEVCPVKNLITASAALYWPPKELDS